MAHRITIDQEEHHYASAHGTRRRGFCLTARDRALVQLVAELCWATRNQICDALFSPGASSNCQRRLTLLKTHGYLDVVAGRSSTEPAVYRATRKSRSKGLVELEEQSRTHGAQLGHVLAINDVRCRFLRASRAHAYTLSEWKSQAELAGLSEVAAFVPDGAFVVSSEAEGRRLVAPFLLEVERSPRRPAWMKEKYRRIGAFVASGGYERIFGRRSVRLLVVTAAGSADEERRWARRLAVLAGEVGLAFARFGALRDLVAVASDPFVSPVWRTPATDDLRGLGPLESGVHLQ